MAADKNYCMSSFLAFRYIVDGQKDFAPELRHKHFVQMPDERKIPVKSAQEIDRALEEQFRQLSGEKLGILLSGGMDSAILAAYMPGADAYTFRFMGGEYQKAELNRAEYYADYYGLKLHYVDIDWQTVLKAVDPVMARKQAPVHSIEPQIYIGAMQAKDDGISKMIIGDASDYVFGGMDQLLSRDWKYEEFYQRFIYIDPERVLKDPVSMKPVFEPFRRGEEIDFMGMMDSITVDESYASYENAFLAADMPYVDPYEPLKMDQPLDLSRVRNGESKYLIRELFRMKYPDYPVPEKVPMPRPVDLYFKDWQGPTRPEFRENLDMAGFTGNQKWLLWCLERFLNRYCGD